MMLSINKINRVQGVVLYFTIDFNSIVIRNASWDCSSKYSLVPFVFLPDLSNVVIDLKSNPMESLEKQMI